MEIIRKWKVLAVVCLIGFSTLASAAEESSMTPAEKARALAEARAKAIARARNRSQQTARDAETEKDSFKDTSVLVEAFVVRVSTAGLIKSGVNQISKAPDGVSYLNILWCLGHEDYARVVSGSKVTASHNEQGFLARQQRKYIKRTSSNVSAGNKPVTTTNVTYDSYQIGDEFSAVPLVKSNEDITLKVNYEQVGIDENKNPDVPVNLTTIEWKGVVSVKSGYPVIAAAIYDDEETISFLILTATIQDKQPVRLLPDK